MATEGAEAKAGDPIPKATNHLPRERAALDLALLHAVIIERYELVARFLWGGVDGLRALVMLARAGSDFAGKAFVPSINPVRPTFFTCDALDVRRGFVLGQQGPFRGRTPITRQRARRSHRGEGEDVPHSV